MRITAIKKQRREDRVSIFLDGRYWFGAPAAAVSEFGLSVGQELTERERNRIEGAAASRRWYEKALRYINYRFRSEAEVGRKLSALGAAPPEVEVAIVRLRVEGFLDDSRFAELWIVDRDRIRPMGRDRLRAELLAKGVDRGIIETLLAERDAGAELQVARALLTRRFGQGWPVERDRAEQGRYYAFLRRRGYPSSVIREVLDSPGP